MLVSVIVVLERLLCIEWRVDVDALNLAGELLFEGFERQQVVAKNQTVVKDVAVRESVRSME